MAGGNYPKASSQKASSSSHRKSRWESGNNPSTDKKPSATGDSKPPPKPSPNPKPRDNPTPKPKDNATPKSGPSSGPSHPKPPTEPLPRPALGPLSSGSQPPFPDALGPPPPPAYGFHMLERRTIVLADGSVRSYFALPPDYQDLIPPARPIDHGGRLILHGPGLAGLDLGFDKRFPPAGPMSPEFRDREDSFIRSGNQDYWSSVGRGGPVTPDNPLKRKYGDEGEKGGREEIGGKDDFARQRQQLLQYGHAGLNPSVYTLGSGERGEFLAGTSGPYRRDLVASSRGDELRAAKSMRIGGDFDNFHGRQGGIGSESVVLKHNTLDQGALKKAFLHYAKLVNENPTQRRNYFEDGRQGTLQCVACGRCDKIGLDVSLC